MTRTAIRIAFAVVFCSPLALAGFAPAAFADMSLTVGKAAANADPIIPVNVGYKLGIFKKHGLDLKIIDFTGGSKMAQGLAAGSIDIGDGAGSEMALVYKGVPAKAICETTTTFPFLSIGVPHDSPIKSLDGLKGKRVGISHAGSLTDFLAHELAKKKGWGPNGVTTVAIGNGSAGIVAAFRQHLVDADVSVTSLFLTMEVKKNGRLLAPVTDFEGPMASGSLYATDHLMKSNPAAIRAFLAGWIDTIRYMLSHKAETVKIESEITGFPESVMSREYDIVRSMYNKDCRYDNESITNLRNTLVALKELPPSVDMSKLYTEEYLPKM